MNTYKLNELSAKGDLVETITSLVNEENCIELQNIGLVDNTNVDIVCNTISAVLKINNRSTRKPYRKRTEEFDIMVAEYSRTHTVRETSILFDIAPSTVQYIKRKRGIC